MEFQIKGTCQFCFSPDRVGSAIRELASNLAYLTEPDQLSSLYSHIISIDHGSLTLQINSARCVIIRPTIQAEPPPHAVPNLPL